MHHFFVTPAQVAEETIVITGSDVNHIKNVLRMKTGEQLMIRDGVSNNYLCAIEIMEERQVQVKILTADKDSTELPARIYLFQGLPKSDKMELIIQKAVELGAYQIIPVATRRAVVKLDEKKAEARRKRWNTIAEGAAKQSGRMLVPEVAKVMSLKEAFDYAAALDCNLIPYELAAGIHETKAALSRIRPGMQIGVFIGPEGGFDTAEIELAKSRKVMPITLGRRILRTETAGLTALSILMFQLESMQMAP